MVLTEEMVNLTMSSWLTSVVHPVRFTSLDLIAEERVGKRAYD